jgi:hypothetical protein
MTAFISAVTIEMGIMPPIIIAAPNGDIRYGRPYYYSAAATGSHVTDTTGKNNHEETTQYDCQKTGIPTPTPCFHVAT